MSTVRDKVRAAQLARQQLEQLRRHRIQQQVYHVGRVAGSLQRFLRLSRQLARAHESGWHAAASYLLEQIDRTSDQLRLEFANLPRLVDRTSLSRLVSLREIWDDLDQIEQEFVEAGGWTFDAKAATLSVTTEAIELQDVYLGAFRIRLDLRELPSLHDRRPYRILALDAHPADGHGDVVHPHVTGEQLCEGDASPAIRGCLESGRLADFFLVVRSVLRTYNRLSAYVQLEEWSSSSCPECGGRSEELSSCEQCRDEVCDDCIHHCRPCQGYYCPSCTASCSHCEEIVCRNCLQTCRACGARCCVDCLVDELCGECRERIEDDVDDHSPPDGPAAANSAPAADPETNSLRPATGGILAQDEAR